MRVCLRACKTEQATHCTVSADYPNGQHFKTLPVIHFIRWSLQVLYFPMACPLSPLSAAVSPGHSVYLDSFEAATACSGCSRPLATSVWHKHLSLPLDPNYIEHRTSVFCPMTLGKNQEVTALVRGRCGVVVMEEGLRGAVMGASLPLQTASDTDSNIRLLTQLRFPDGIGSKLHRPSRPQFTCL